MSVSNPNDVKNNIQESFKDILNKAKEKKKPSKDDDKEKDSDDDSSDDDDNEDDKSEKKNKKDKSEVKEKDGKKKVEVTVEEGTEAANSLHPAAKSISDPKALTSSKLGMMNHTMGLMNGMGKDDMVSFFDKVISQYGSGKDYGVSDNSGKNQSTLNMHGSHAVSSKGAAPKEPMPKLNVKEDLDGIFGETDLSEEFKENATTLFEAAVSARIIAETARLEEQYAELLAEELITFHEETTQKLDSYLDYVIENWIKENEVAIESSLRNELTSEFIDGLRTLFAEHYVEIPEERVNVLEQLADKVNELESKLNEQIFENTELKGIISENKASAILEELSSDLTMSQKEKFAALAEGIEFNGDTELFGRKLNVIKNNYFTEEHKTTNIEEEVYEGDEMLSESVKHVNPDVKPYADYLSKIVKK